jgi:hypothetical protein
MHTHTPNIHAVSGIRTHDHSVRASEGSSCLRPLGYSDRPVKYYEKLSYLLYFYLDRTIFTTTLREAYLDRNSLDILQSKQFFLQLL